MMLFLLFAGASVWGQALHDGGGGSNCLNQPDGNGGAYCIKNFLWNCPTLLFCDPYTNVVTCTNCTPSEYEVLDTDRSDFANGVGVVNVKFKTPGLKHMRVEWTCPGFISAAGYDITINDGRINTAVQINNQSDPNYAICKFSPLSLSTTFSTGCSPANGTVKLYQIVGSNTILLNTQPLPNGGSIKNVYTFLNNADYLAAGYYKIEVQGGAGLAGTTSAVAFFKVLELPNITITGNTTPCAGQNVTLTASGLLPTDLPPLANGGYQWSSNPSTNHSRFTTIVAPSTNAFYIVTATDAKGCTNTKSIQVTTTKPEVQLDFSTTPNIMGQLSGYCAADDLGVYLIATPNLPNVTYTWAGSAAFTTPVGSATNAAFTNPRTTATYTVTVTTGNGCTATTSTIISSGCCIPDLTGATYTNVTTSTIPNIFQNPTGNRLAYLITGILTVDTDVNIANADVYMCEGAQIIVKNGHSLTIGGSSNLKGLDRLWRGILVETGGKLSLVGVHISGSPTNPTPSLYPVTIEDAYQAVILQPGAKFYARLAYFYNNYISIITERANTRQVYAMDISESRFTANRNLKPPYSGQPTISNAAYAGIILNDAKHVSWTDPNAQEGLTDHWQNGSTFSNLRYGIQLWNSEARVKYSKFTNINAFTSFGLINPNPEVYDGTAVTARNNSKLTMSKDAGTAIWNTDDIEYCRNGVIIQQSDANLSEYTLSAVTNGIGIRLCKGNIVNINRCDITCSGIGIHLFSNTSGTFTVGAAANETDAMANNISDNGGTPTGIRIDGTNDGLCNYLINRNTISTCITGISLNSSRPTIGSAISHNTITLPYVGSIPITPTGIAITNTNNFAIETNTITGQGANQGSAIGINLNASNVKLCQNTTTQTATGMRLQANCSTTALSGNQIGYHTTGVEYSPTLTMQAQQDLGNTFTGTYGNVGAYNGNVSMSGLGQPIIPGQIFTNQTGQLWTTQKTNLPSVQNWFKPTFNAQTICPLTIPRPAAYEEAIAEGTITNEYPTEMQWWTKKDLYEDMVAGRNTTQTTILQDFKDSLQNTTMGDLTDVKQAATVLFKPSETLNLQISNYKQQIATLDAQSEAISAAIYADSTNSNPSLRTEADNIKILLSANYTALEQIQTAWKTETDNQADDLKAQNELIAPVLLQEIQQKIVNDIYFSTLAKGQEELAETQISTLRFLANQCPHTGGSAVFEARSLLAAIEPNNYDDKDLCAVQGISYRIKPKTSQSNSINTSITIKPNPANTMTTLDFSGITEKQEGNIEVIDVLGKVVYTSIYTGSLQQRIPLETLANGIYFLRLNCTNMTVINIGKLNVIK